MFRDADRIARILAADGNAPEHRATMQEVMAHFDRAAVLRLCAAELDGLANGPIRRHVEAAYRALAARDASSMIASADALHQARSAGAVSATAASAALVLAGAAFTPHSLRPTDFPAKGSP